MELLLGGKHGGYGQSVRMDWGMAMEKVWV